MVADDTPEEQSAGVDGGVRKLNGDFGVVVFQVGVASTGSYVDSFGDIGVTDISVVLFVDVSVEDRWTDFASDFAEGTEVAVAVDFCSGIDDSVSTDIAWTEDDSVVFYFNIIIDDDDTFGGIEDGSGFDFDISSEDNISWKNNGEMFVFRKIFVRELRFE